MAKKVVPSGIEVSPNERCPCGSGLLYRNCHARTEARYFVEGDKTFRPIRLQNKELIKRLREKKAEFLSVFGRPADDRDLMFFDRIAVGGDHQFFSDVQRIASETGVDEELIFASRRTERFVSSVNWKFLSPPERREWVAAIEEYRRSADCGHNPFYRFTFLGPRQFESYLRATKLLMEVSYVLDCSIQYIIDRGDVLRNSADTFVVSTMANTATTLVFISRTMESHFSDDVVGVSRGVFEDYLRIKCIRLGSVSDEAILLAQMASRGYASFAKRANGKPDFDTVLLDDDHRVDVGAARSFARLSKLTGNPFDELLYDSLYRELSSHVHRDILKVLQSFMESGNLPVFDENDKVLAVYYVGFVLLIYLEELIENGWLGERVSGDLTRKAKELAKCLEHIGRNKALQRRLPVRFI